MKTRYKIFLVVCFFITFYFSLIPLLQLCIALEADCIALKELVLVTRPIVTSGENVWDTGNGINAWTGTPEELENSSLEDQIAENISFIVSMIILLFVIIGFVVVMDRK